MLLRSRRSARCLRAGLRGGQAPRRRRDGVPGGGEGGGGAGVADPLEACPPGGERTVVFYTTSLRGVGKTFEDCARVRRLVEGLRGAFLERDVSMHAPYREELRALLCDLDGGADQALAFPVSPRLFVDGRYLGGAEEVVTLNERSQLRPGGRPVRGLRRRLVRGVRRVQWQSLAP
ncbi:hypothetical protein BAE44_0012688 [Dichanthelium oligosanthes]|uniref:Glutaredoxin domain-containing protein n=1 Tax=Dichanthelium oligosanthes TaxID=888268 RepID=A0A1E5VMD9_9POAL|nr:hypothetical protein BAE44_0012688 [Dichanthelium oligosanthes]